MTMQEARELLERTMAIFFDPKKLGFKVVPDDRIVKWTDPDLAGHNWIYQRTANDIFQATELVSEILNVAEAAIRSREFCNHSPGSFKRGEADSLLDEAIDRLKMKVGGIS